MKATMSARPKAVMLIVGLIAISAVVFGLQAWAALPSLAAPTISSKPADPTSSTSATLAFTGPSGATFQCQLDAAAVAACGSPKTYPGPLTQGRHTFQVKAVSGSKVSSVTSYSWRVDTAPPTVTINQASGQADPTNSNNGPVAFTATFSEPVTGFTNTDVTAGGTAGGTKSIAVTGTGSVYTVTISGATGNGTITASVAARTFQDLVGNTNTTASTSTDNTVTLDNTPPPAPSIGTTPASLSNSTSASFSFTDTELRVTFRCAIDGSAFTACTSPRTYSDLRQGANTFAVQAVDVAGNASTSTAYSWSIDTVAPPAPVLTQKPSDPTSNATVTFAWTGEALATFQCEIENGSWFACSTPYTYVIGTTNNQQHQFGVRAVDSAKNVSGAASFSFKYKTAAGLPFTISGNLSGLLAPGRVLPLQLTLTNTNSNSLSVTNLSVTLKSVTRTDYAISHNQQCGLGDYAVVQYGGPYPLIVPGSSSRTLGQLGVGNGQLPQITLLNRAVNQDGCKGATLALTYSGSGQGN